MIERVFLKNIMKSNNLLITFQAYWRQYSGIIFWKQSLERMPSSDYGI